MIAPRIISAMLILTVSRTAAITVENITIDKDLDSNNMINVSSDGNINVTTDTATKDSVDVCGNTTCISGLPQTGMEQMDSMVTMTTEESMVAEEVYLENMVADHIYQIYIPICVGGGIIGNVMAFCVLVLTSLRRTTTCLYMAVISCLDSLILIMDLVFYLDMKLKHVDIVSSACGPIMFLFYVFIHYDVLLLVAMTTERFIAVRFPLHIATMVTPKKAAIVITALGVFAVGINAQNIFTRSAVVDPVTGRKACRWEGELNTFYLTKVHPWVDSSLYCFIPLSSLFLLNILIIWNLKSAARKQQKMTQANGNKSSGGGEGSGQSQRQVTIMLMLVTFTFLVLTTPVASLVIIDRYFWFPSTAHDRAKAHLVHSVIDNLMYTNHAVNFFLYCLSGKKFRQEFCRLCRRQPKRSKRTHVYTRNIVSSPSTTTSCTDVSVTSSDSQKQSLTKKSGCQTSKQP